MHLTSSPYIQVKTRDPFPGETATCAPMEAGVKPAHALGGGGCHALDTYPQVYYAASSATSCKSDDEDVAEPEPSPAGGESGVGAGQEGRGLPQFMKGRECRKAQRNERKRKFQEGGVSGRDRWEAEKMKRAQTAAPVTDEA